MKAFKYFMTLVLMLTMSVCFTSCGSDEEVTEDLSNVIGNFTIEVEQVTGGNLDNESLFQLKAVAAELFYDPKVKEMTRGVKVSDAIAAFDGLTEAFGSLIVDSNIYYQIEAKGDIYFVLSLAYDGTGQVVKKRTMVLNNSTVKFY